MMKIVALSILALGLAAPVLADPPLPASISPGSIVSAVSGLWDDTTGPDRAVLIDDPDHVAVDLAIYAGSGDAPNRHMQAIAFAHDIAASGTAPGTIAELRQTRDGKLIIHSEQTLGGRDQWKQDMQLAYRNGHFVVAGLKITAWDPMDASAGGTCDLNYLSGKGTAGKAATVTVSSGGVPVEAWTRKMIPNACVF